MDIKIKIKFDRFPGTDLKFDFLLLGFVELIFFARFTEDTEWELFRYCNDVRELMANGGPYNTSLSEKEITVFDEEVVDGFFLFRITDAYGDGLCCEQGEGSFTIEYGSTVIESKFEVIRPGDKIEEEVDFGDKSKCLVSSLVFFLTLLLLLHLTVLWSHVIL